MSLLEYTNRNTPDYSPFMYLDGHKPEVILASLRNEMTQKREQNTTEDNDIPTTKIVCEVKIL